MRNKMIAVFIIVSLALVFVTPVTFASWWDVLLGNPILFAGTGLEGDLGAGFHSDVLNTKQFGPETTSNRAQSVFDTLLPLAKQQRANLTYRLTILDSEVLNAFAAPGGFIYVTTGLLSVLDDDELAGVLGHELAHTVHSHTLQQWSLATSLQVIQNTTLAEAAAIGEIIRGLAGLGYSRAQETEADLVGQAWAYRAGYLIDGLPNALMKISSVGSPPDWTEFLQSHPHTARRVEALQINAEKLTKDPSYDPLAKTGTRHTSWLLLLVAIVLAATQM